ncbi:MAG: insulinase family protein [Thermoguttaceae bacterium]|nr:insulinase family protein [Thermoguttaceae bacterium]MDW8080114.1 pitrilysin family protein [Thermoguttaceae bacterium]
MNYKLRRSDFRCARLANGLEVIAECHPDAYSVGLGLFVGVGARDEPLAWAGVSHFLEHMAFKGNARFSAEELNAAFEEIGAFHNAATDEECTTYHVAVLPEYWPRALELLGELIKPSFPADQFELERGVILEEIAMDLDNPPYAAEDICRRLYFGPHPLGNSILGSKESIGALRAEDMQRYFLEHYGPDNAALVATGQIDFDQFVRKAEEVFGSWRPCGYRRDVTPPVTFQEYSIIHKPASKQQYLIHVAPAPAGLPDWTAMWLLTSILGGHEGGRLYWELVEPGLVEEIALAFEEYQGAAVYCVGMTCEPDRAEENFRRLWDFYRRLPDEPIRDDELEWAKNKVSSGLVLASEMSIQRLGVVGDDWMLERRYYSVGELLEMIAAVTPERIAQLIKEYPFTRGTVVTVGPLKKLAPPPDFPARLCAPVAS